MRFQESIIAAATVVLIPFANGTASVTGDEFCKALVQDRASRCVDDLCTFGNGMEPKYSCSQSDIDNATRIYDNYVAGTNMFPSEYSHFLTISRDIGFRGRVRGHIMGTRLHINVFLSILNVFLYIPNNIWDIMKVGILREPKREWEEFRDEVDRYIQKASDHSYACIAVLDIIGVPVDLIRYTLLDNLMLGLTELYKYTILSRQMYFSVEESLHLFALIKNFHERGLSANPEFHFMRLAIANSLFKIQACLKPEFAVAQKGYITPVNFSAWSNLVNSIRGMYPNVILNDHEPLLLAEDIINTFTNDHAYDYNNYYSDSRELTSVQNPLMLDILTGLITGAGMEMPRDDHVGVRVKLSRSQLLRASVEKLYQLEQLSRFYGEHRPKLIMLWRLIIANQFETIPNDVDNPIAFQKTDCKYSEPLRAYYEFLSPPSLASVTREPILREH